MRRLLASLRLQDIGYRLPVFLAAVSIAPNFNEARLLGVFAVTHLLVYPASAFIRDVLGDQQQRNRFWWLITLAVPVVAYRTGVWYAAGVLAYLLIVAAEAFLRKPKAVLMWRVLADGVIMLAVAYCGLNDYNPTHALQAKVIIMGLAGSVTMFFLYGMRTSVSTSESNDTGDLRRTAIGLFLRLLAGWTGAMLLIFSGSQVVYFLMCMILAAAWLLFWNLRSRSEGKTFASFFTALSTAGLVFFLIWLFLNTTNVLQVFG